MAMSWHRGLRRLRLVGTVALAIGVICLASVYTTHALGYAPDVSVQPLFALMGRLGLLLTLLGVLVSVTAWVLQGFAPTTPAGAHEPESLPRRARSDE